MSIAEALAAHHEPLVDLMIRTTMMPAGSSEADTRQFVVGYVSILSAAANGDFGPRDEYLQSVIPAIRDGGMPLQIVMEGMVRVATAAAAMLGPEHAQWLSDFQGDYTVKILDIWEKK
jgi:hypothetical protein